MTRNAGLKGSAFFGDLIAKNNGNKNSNKYQSMKKRVIIIGAGASKSFCPEFGVGSELVEQILQRLSEDNLHPSKRYLTKVIDYFEQEESGKHKEVGRLFRSQRKDLAINLSNFLQRKDWEGTIDEFVSNFPEYQDIVNFCIAFHIAGYEGASLNSMNYSETWLFRFCNCLEYLLFDSEKPLEDLSIDVITFNYDRLLEQYLFFYFSSRGRWNKQVEKFTNNNIKHVYGSLGKLPWQVEEGAILYGVPNSHRIPILAASKQIKTMYQMRNNITEIISLLSTAEEVWCLGFGYDMFNIQTIGLSKIEPSKIYGAAYNCHDAERAGAIMPSANIITGDSLHFIKRIFALSGLPSFDKYKCFG